MGSKGFRDFIQGLQSCQKPYRRCSKVVCAEGPRGRGSSANCPTPSLSSLRCEQGTSQQASQAGRSESATDGHGQGKTFRPQRSEKQPESCRASMCNMDAKRKHATQAHSLTDKNLPFCGLSASQCREMLTGPQPAGGDGELPAVVRKHIAEVWVSPPTLHSPAKGSSSSEAAKAQRHSGKRPPASPTTWRPRPIALQACAMPCQKPQPGCCLGPKPASARTSSGYVWRLLRRAAPSRARPGCTSAPGCGMCGSPVRVTGLTMVASTACFQKLQAR